MTDLPKAPGWRVWIDRGGTFTDVIAAAPDGRLITRKLLSENPLHYRDAAEHAITDVLADHPGAHLEEVRIGTTVATNALLERQGAKTALLITGGLKDVLEIGTQHRPDLFALHVERAPALYSNVYEIKERVSIEGDVLIPLDERAVHDALESAKQAGCTAVAICFLHGLRHPAHEHRALDMAKPFGFKSVTASHLSSARHKLVPRGQTAVADAYLSPVLNSYVQQVESGVDAQCIFFMKSDGGVTPSSHFRGKDAVLSGPAGGIVGAVHVAKAHGYDKVIAFDMGGTSTDVAHYAGAYDQAEMPELAGVKLDVPMLDIHTVASGGGSILRYRDGRFQVGPASAGAQPGPAAYGRGGPLTITDCHVLLGRLQPGTFPKIFGESGKDPLDATRVRTLFTQLRDEIDPSLCLEEVAEGFLDVACEQMARAIKKVTQERGIDPSDYVLVAFGGAGGQCACRVAQRIGVKTILLHPFAGLLSALGIGLTSQTVRLSNAIDCPLETADIQTAKDGLKRRALKQLPSAALHYTASVRQRGSDMALTIGAASPGAMAAAFRTEHKTRFGFAPEAALHIDALHCLATEKTHQLDAYTMASADRVTAPQSVSAAFGERRDVPLLDARSADALCGPAILLSDGSTTVVEPGWRAAAKEDGTLILTAESETAPAETTDQLDPIQLEIFHHRFMAIAEQMGAVLERTAHSINIKERLDFSCAIFDAEGQLVANAPHMPVHLGSMGETVTALIKRGAAFAPGTAFAHNDPYDGGTHLPDITVVMPVFSSGSDQAFAYVASRGHHADIGGVTPGSMPAHSRSIAEEGCIFSATQILRCGRIDKQAIQRALQSGAYPARSPNTNIADLRAQIASCETGARALRHLSDQVSAEHVTRYMGYIQDNAEAVVARLLKRLNNGEANSELEGFGTLRVRIALTPDKARARIDFTGTSKQGSHNFNAPLAVTKAAVLFVLRCLVDEDIPLNAGCLRPIDVTVPPGCLLNPRPPAAVVAGNVETSQAVTNLLFEALGARANSQGTMNNIIFGNAGHQYYETLGGGTGAGPDFDGDSAIHSDMTNSRLTDPEVLESRLPLRVTQMQKRLGSGGNGRRNGGDGLAREFMFLEKMELSVLSSHRASGPRGLDEGMPGAAGVNTLTSDGREMSLPAQASCDIKPGDTLRIETPGGGGFGPAGMQKGGSVA